MTALAADRKVDIVAGASTRYRVAKVAGGVRIFKGALIARNPLGFTVPAADALGLRAFGIAQEQVDNTLGADGAAEVKYLTGVSAKFKIDATSPVTQANQRWATRRARRGMLRRRQRRVAPVSAVIPVRSRDRGGTLNR